MSRGKSKSTSTILRDRAEAKFAEESLTHFGSSEQASSHELRVHQIELEMQCAATTEGCTGSRLLQTSDAADGNVATICW